MLQLLYQVLLVVLEMLLLVSHPFQMSQTRKKEIHQKNK